MAVLDFSPNRRKIKRDRPKVIQMRSLRKITVGVSAQAYLLLAMTAVWYGSVFGWMSEMDNRKVFWTSLFLGLPWVMLLLGIILLVSYWQSGRRHPWLVWSACFAAVTPWLWLLGVVFNY